MKTNKTLNLGLVFIVLTVLMLASVQSTMAQGGTWSTKASMPTPRVSFGIGVVNGILYAVGGGDCVNPVPLGMDAYNPVTDTWTAKAPMPTGRSGLAVGVVNGILYAIGGKLSGGFGALLGTVEAYDPVTDTWTTKAPMPTPRQHVSAAVVNGIIYVFEGANSPGNSTIAVVEAYDPVSNTWTTKAPMPTPRFLTGVGVANGIAYVVGGHNGSATFASNEAYDPANNIWTAKASMSIDRAGPGVGMLNGQLYAVGGGSTSAGILSLVEAYDPSANTWTAQAPMPTPRYLLAAVVVNGVLYAVGGQNNTGCLAVNEAFTPTGVTITSVTLSSGGELQQNGTLDFAGGDDWGNTPPDEIRSIAEAPGQPNPNIKWSVIDLSAGEATPDRGTGTAYSFRVRNLPAQDPYSQRPAIHLRVIARLLDASGSEIARDEKRVIQSQLGTRRQEYVDHPVQPVDSLPKVPPPSEFDGALEIISPWADAAGLAVLRKAASTGLATQITSIYRSPVHHWNVYLQLSRPVNTRSQHMWGTAVDFAVFDYNGRHGVDRQDWATLGRLVSSLGFHVVDEGRADHIHIQQFSPGGEEY